MQTELFTFVMPSGMKYEAREMTVEDMNLLASGKNTQDTLNAILRKNIIKFDEAMPDNLPANVLKFEKNFDPLSSPIADTFTAMVMMRRVTLGDDYYFKIKCQSCTHEWHQHISLKDDQFKPKSIQFAIGNDLSTGVDPKNLQFIVKLPEPYKGIVQLTCRLLRGYDQESLTEVRLTKRDSMVSERLKLLIISADIIREGMGIEKIDLSDELIRSMGFKISQSIDNVYKDFDGGIETSGNFECPRCQHTNDDVMIPISDGKFFLLKSTIKPYGKK